MWWKCSRYSGKKCECSPPQDLRNAPVAECKSSSGHTAENRPPTALRWLEIKLRPAGEVGRSSEHLALDYSENQHFAFLFSYQLQRHGLLHRKRVSDLEYFESLYVLIWCLRKCVLISACPSKSWFEGCEKQPSACNKILWWIHVTLYRCVQNWIKTVVDAATLEYTITCKGSQYKINNSLNKVMLGKYGSYSYSSFHGAHCWCLAAVLLRMNKAHGDLELQLMLQGFRAHSTDRHLGNSSWTNRLAFSMNRLNRFTKPISPERVVSESDWAVYSVHKSSDSRVNSPYSPFKMTLFAVT